MDNEPSCLCKKKITYVYNMHDRIANLTIPYTHILLYIFFPTHPDIHSAYPWYRNLVVSTGKNFISGEPETVFLFILGVANKLKMYKRNL